jgi:hypothetical protein
MEIAYCKRSPKGYNLPEDFEHFAKLADAVWITNPVYCTSMYYSARDADRLRVLAQSGVTVVLDECLCELGHQLAPSFPREAEVVALLAPHKSICVNGLKFAAVVFGKKWQDTFDSWADVWLGCLPLSSVLGTRHLLGSDFLSYSSRFKDECATAFAKLKAIVLEFSTLSIDKDPEGYLVSVFAPSLPAELGLDFQFLERSTQATGAIFIAGLRNQLDPAAGLSFRVNLAALDKAAEGALHRLCFFLEREALDGLECSIR